MPLRTRCAHCGRDFTVYAQQLKARRGWIDCPHCGDQTDAVAMLIDEPGFGAAREPGEGERPRRGGALAAARPSLIPDAVPTPPRASAASRLVWGLASLALLLVLGTQIAWWQRADLLRDPLGFQALTALCDRLGCAVPLARLPGALGVLEPSLAPDADSGALVLRLRIANRAPLPQPAPLLELELYDRAGDLAAARRFSPGEYRAAAPAEAGAITAPIAPGETRAIALAIAPPDAETSGFKVRLQ